MTNDYSTVWDQCLRILKKELDYQSYKTWFEPVKAISLVDSALTIQVPNKFFYQTLEDRFVGVLGRTLMQIIGKSARLEYQILVDNHRKIGHHTNQKTGDLPKKFSTIYACARCAHQRCCPHGYHHLRK